MKRTHWMLLSAGLVLFFGIGGARKISAADQAFVGSDRCKMCHNTEAKGAQYKKWTESLHAKAFATLGTDKAKEFAKAKGIADPQKAAECLQCHQTGHGAPAAMLTDKYRADEGVGCESCHGAGAGYWKMDVMKVEAKAIAGGLSIPNEETCKKCHNPKSPSYKTFDFKTFAAKIAHPLKKK